MVEYVVKRDGSLENFDKTKIVKAIEKAMMSESQLDKTIAESIADTIAENISDSLDSHVTVSNDGAFNFVYIETIQDLVEENLMAVLPKVAKSYILFRESRNIARGRKNAEHLMGIVDVTNDEIMKENANMNSSTPAGMMMKIASESSKPFTDNYLISAKSREYVKNNIIHIHDKDYFPTKSLTCLQHPLNKIFQNGFRAGHGASRPAKRIETAAIQACISLESIQNEMHGGQAIPAFDFYLAPYVRSSYMEEIDKLAEIMEFPKDDIRILKNINFKDYDLDNLYWGKPSSLVMNYDKYIRFAVKQTIHRVHQSMESFVHNMNTIHSRGGNQVVFSSINYGTDTSAEGRCVIREILKSTYRGVGNGETPIFPIQVFKVKNGVNYSKDDRNNDLLQYAYKVTAKRFFPNFLNLDATFNKHDKWNATDPNRYMYEVATMGCRTRMFEDRFGEKTSIGRGNLSFTTINIVKLALMSRNIEDNSAKMKKFYELVDDAIDAAAEQLHDRFIFQSSARKYQFPMLMSGMWKGSENISENDTIGDVIKTGSLAIGFIGLAECLIALTGKHHGESDESQKLGLEIVKHMYDRVKSIADKYDLNYSLFATPAESLSGGFVKQDAIEFGKIEHITDKEYYTNSSHIPVWYKCSAEHKAAIEGPYHQYEPAGHIFYVELDGDATHNPECIKQVVDLTVKYNIGYSSVNHIRNRCLDCGYEDASKEFEKCPICGSKNVDIIERITGYLVGSVNKWNDAKKAELRDRVTHC